MVKIQVRKEPDGWRAVIRRGKQIVVLDKTFDGEEEAFLEAASAV